MEKVWEGEGAEEGAAHLATPLTPLESQEGKEMTPITPGGIGAKNVPANGISDVAHNATRNGSNLMRAQAKAKNGPAQSKQAHPHARQQNPPATPQQQFGSAPYQGGKIPAWSQVKRARMY